MAPSGHIVVNTAEENVPVIGRVLDEAGLSYQAFAAAEGSEFLAACRMADGLIIHSPNVPVTRALIESLERCRVIVRLGVGVDNVDVEAATERGIAVANVPDYCDEEVASHAVALLFAVLRQVPQYDRSVRQGIWRHDVVNPVPRLSKLTVGVLGFGRIGRAFYARVRPSVGQVLVYDPYVPAERVRETGAVPAPLEEVFAQSDAISIHLPLTKETRGLVDQRLLGLMKPTAYLINTARGPVVDEEALIEALRTRQIAGAGLDVLVAEPPAGDHPVFGLENVVITPHVAWYSEDAKIDLLERGAREAARAVLQGWPRPEAFVNPAARDVARARGREAKGD